MELSILLLDSGFEIVLEACLPRNFLGGRLYAMEATSKSHLSPKES